MRLDTPLSAKEYVREFSRQMGAFTSFGEERFTGVFLGHFFSVCYHSGWEWNRKLTNEKNRAIGYVVDTPEGSEVRFLWFYGYSDPVSIALLFLLGFIAGFIVFLLNGFELTRDEGLFVGCICGALITIPLVIESALAALLTERGQYGAGVLNAYLKNPRDPWNHD